MKRVRLHGAIIDVNSIEKGMKFDQLPECYIIFIIEHDTFGFCDVLYSIHKTIDGRNIRVDDGQHILFLNCSAKDDGSKAWKLVHDMMCVDPEKIFIPEIAKTVKDNKDPEVIEEKKGEPAMDRFSQYLRERFKDDLDYAEERGEKRTAVKFIKNFCGKAKMTLEQIAAIVEPSLDKTKSLYESAAK